MDGKPDDATGWGNKFKQAIAINKQLVPLKLTMLLYYGAVSLYLPYMTLQMIQVGLNIEEIAIIYSVLPFVTSIMPPIAGMLADRFHSYKLILIVIVASVAVFHTSLLHIDARLSTDAPTTGMDFETPAEIYCTRLGAVLRFENFTCDANREMWTVDWTPSQCQPMDCQLPMRMQLCLADGNCTQIAIGSTSMLEMDALLEVVPTTSLDGDHHGNCTAHIVNAQTDQTRNPASLLCNCPIRCPAMAAPMSSDLNNATTTTTTTTTNGLSVEEQQQQKENERVKHNRGFWLYFILRIIASGSLATSFSMLDATAIKMVKKHHGDLGKQRLFGVIGQAICAVLAGIILDWTVIDKGYPDYSITFYLADGMFVVVVILMSQLDVGVEEHTEATKLMKSISKLIRLIDVDIFMIMMLLLGTCWGFLESFLFVYLTELNASSYLLGMTITFASIIGIPFLYVSDVIVRKIGSVNVIVLAFLAYCIRFFGYSFIWDPWLSLPFEALEAVTVHMMAVASSIYCAAAAPPGLLATLNGAVGSFHYSFGRGVGSFAGGIMMANFGTRTTFRILGAGAGICGLVYFLLHRFYLARLEKNRLQRKSIRPSIVISEEAVPMKVNLDVETNEKDDPVDEDDTTDEHTMDYLFEPDGLKGRRLSAF